MQPGLHAQSAGPGAPLRVFIVEDSLEFQERLIAMLEATGIAKIEGCAETVGESIREILEAKPDVLLLDLRLADGSGLEVLRATRPSLPAMRVAVVTNNATAQYRRACQQAGAHAFLDKSMDVDRLPELMRRWASGDGGEPTPFEIN